MGQEDSESGIFGPWVYIPQLLLLCFTIYSFIEPEKFWTEFPAFIIGDDDPSSFCFCLLPLAILFSFVPNNSIDDRIPGDYGLTLPLLVIIVIFLTISLIDFEVGFGNFVRWTCAIILCFAILSILPADAVQNSGGRSMFQMPAIVPAGGFLCHSCGQGQISGYRYSECNYQECITCGHGGHCKHCSVAGCWGKHI